MESSERQIEAAERNVALETETAIARIRSTFVLRGDEFCVDCGEPIGARRRAALPSAVRCIDCQRDYEGSSRG